MAEPAHLLGGGTSGLLQIARVRPAARHAQRSGREGQTPSMIAHGGVGPLIALVEAFGFEIPGVNECGQFESRAELIGHEVRDNTYQARGVNR